MIRMGRSSKLDDNANETSALNERSSTTAFPFTESQQHGPNAAVSESESMARDIKEGRLSGFVGSGTVLTGETTFQSMLRIDGHLTGRVTSEDGTLIIGSTGQVDANIEVACAIVNGVVNGDIIAAEKLQLGRTARVVGNIKAPRLLMEDGAILEGGCNMVQSKENLESRIEEQKIQYSTSDLSPASGSEVEEFEEAEEEAFEMASDITDSTDLSDEEIDSLEDEVAESATT